MLSPRDGWIAPLRSLASGAARGVLATLVFAALSLLGTNALAAGCNNDGTCDDAPGPHQETCEGCPSDCDPRPIFTASSHNVRVGAEILFRGDLVTSEPLFVLSSTLQLSPNPNNLELVHAYSQPGDYAVVFKGVDPFCGTPGDSDPQTIHVEPAECNGNGTCEENLGETCETCPAECDKPPTFTMSTEYAQAGAAVDFSGHGADQDPHPAWDFGDGTGHPTGHTMSHSFSIPGNWPVTFPVTFTGADARCDTSQTSAPKFITIGPGPGGCNENQLCEPQLGETCSSCVPDCLPCPDPTCNHNGDCEAGLGETCTTCKVDCDKPPTFTVDTTFGVVGHPLVFRGFGAEDPFPSWDFGNNVHAHNPVPYDHTYTYAYPLAGTWNVRFTGSDHACQTAQASLPTPIVIADEPPCSLEVCEDAAEIEVMSFPPAVCQGTPATATVTVRNIGTNTWTRAAGYKLGPLTDPSPFSTANRVELPAGVQIAPGQTHTFTITLDRVPASGTWQPSWRMVHEHVTWFGGIATPTIQVGPGCSGGGPGGGPSDGDYHCTGTITDAYGAKLAGRIVEFKAEVREQGHPWVTVLRNTGLSNGEGKFDVPLPVASSIDPYERLQCRVSPQLASNPSRPKVKYLHPPLANGATIVLDIEEAPAPTHTRGVRGLVTEPAARMALYRQQGPYDHVVVIAEPLNHKEMVTTALKMDDLWWTLQSVMRPLHAAGVEAWIVHTGSTLQNLHEQAAEVAEAVEWAARGFPATLPGGAPNFSRQVGLLGPSAGGIKARIATARWAAPGAANDAWRHELGLQLPIPVNALVFLDAPLKGARVSVDLQGVVWRDAKAFGMNSCATQQLLFHSKVSPLGWCDQGACILNHRAFFQDGTSPGFPGPGTCDTPSGGICHCDAGPAVDTINGNGYANVPTFAYSDGEWNVPTQCYGEGNDWDRSAAGDDLCPDKDGPFVPHDGDNMLHFDVTIPLPLDQWVKATPLDLVPGSRQSAPIGDFYNGLVQETEQFFAGTFIPITSALSNPGPNGGCGPAGGPFVACRTSGRSNAHVNPDGDSALWILERLTSGVISANGMAPSAAMATPSDATPGQPVAFDGTPSTDPQGNLIQHRWDFADGTVKVGSTLSHAFAAPGSYSVRLTVTDSTGRTDTATHRVRIGPANERPQPIMAAAATASVGQAVAFDGAASDDADGTIEAHIWNFGDGTKAEGAMATHVYSRPGTYQVSLTVIDDEGDRLTKLSSLIVTEPAYESAAPVAPARCVNNLRPEFSWGAVTWATRYWLQVTSTSLPAPLVDERELTSTTYTPLSDLPATLPLRWRVRACNGTSCGAWSGEQSFTATCSAPPAPSPVTPEGCLTVAQPTLSWTEIGGATSYDLSLERALNGQVVQSANVSGTSYLVPSPLSAVTEYRFRVRANSGATAGAWSPYRFFTTFCFPEQVGTPGPLDPANASYGPIPLFTWEAATNANDYQIEVTSPLMGAFSSGWYAEATNCTANGRCSLTLSAPLIGGASSWRIRGRNASSTGPWSPSVPFTVTGTVESPWALVAAADFDADGKTDFVWQHALSGDVRFWMMNGAVRKAVAEPTPNNPGGGEWEVAGAADFNADGKPDLLFQNVNTGELRVWFMNGTTRIALDTPYPDRPASDVQSWRVQALGDYDGDGKPDILWQHQTEGWVVAWLMNGISQKSVVNPTPNRPSSDYASWKLATAERISRIGRDVHTLWVWQHQTAGWLVGWQMAGLTRDATPAMTPNLPEGDVANWKVVAAYDVDGDGKSDLILRHRQAGANVVWRMNGATRLGTLPLDSY